MIELGWTKFEGISSFLNQVGLGADSGRSEWQCGFDDGFSDRRYALRNQNYKLGCQVGSACRILASFEGLDTAVLDRPNQAVIDKAKKTSEEP